MTKTCSRCGSDGEPLNGCISLTHIKLNLNECSKMDWEEYIRYANVDIVASTNYYLQMWHNRGR